MRRRRLASTGLVLAAALAAPQTAAAVTGPPSQVFGAVRVGTTAAATVSLVAEYAPPAPGEAIAAATITGPDAGDFAVVHDGCAPGPVPAACRIEVAFMPDAAGARAATLHVPGATAAVDVALGGTAFATGPRLAVAPALDFGRLLVGTLAGPAPLTVADTGDLPVAIRALLQTGSAAFLQTSDCVGATLEPGEACTIQVRFAPGIVGPAAAVLRILSDAPAATIVALAGVGTVTPPAVVRTGAVSAQAAVFATDWAPFQIYSARGTRRRIVLRLYSSIPARVAVTVDGVRRPAVSKSVGTGFSHVVVKGPFGRGRRYRLTVVGLPVSGVTNPRRYVRHRALRIRR
jgi:hypothetical protein